MNGTGPPPSSSSSTSSLAVLEDRLTEQVDAGVDAGCWTRIIVFLPVVNWADCVALSTTVRAAVTYACQGEPYRSAEFEIDLGRGHPGTAAVLTALAHMDVPALRLHMDDAVDFYPCIGVQAKLKASLVELSLSGAAWLFFSDKGANRNICCTRLAVLRIENIAHRKGQVLAVFMSSGCVGSLRELRAGCPAHGYDTVGENCTQFDMIIEQMPALAGMATKLETLDIRYSRSSEGLGFDACKYIVSACASLRHLDLTMVMTWRNFDPVLDMLGRKTTSLESLAAGGGLVSHGLIISAAALNDFCTASSQSLQNLQLQSCAFRPLGVPAFHELVVLRRLNLSGSLLLFPQFELSGLPLGDWLQSTGPNLVELVLMGAVLADESRVESDCALQVAAAESWCRRCCPNTDLCSTMFTAVNDTPRFKQGYPTKVHQLHELSAVHALPSFLDRVCTTRRSEMPRVLAQVLSTR